MALIDRFGPSPDDRFSTHAFSAMIYLWKRGEITRNKVVNEFGLNGAEQNQLDDIGIHYDYLNSEAQATYRGLVEGALIAYEAGHITKAKVRNILGMNE